MKFQSSKHVERYMIHLKNSGFTPRDASSLLRKARNLSRNLHATIRDSRVSSKYIEFDISIECPLDDVVEKLSNIGILDHSKHVIEEEIEKETAMKHSVHYFNDERFWECHEVLEGVWKKCFEGEKDLVQGIILIAAAFVHYQKNENDVCLSIFERALQKLAHSSGMYYMIDVDRLRKIVNEMLTSRKISTFAI